MSLLGSVCVNVWVEGWGVGGVVRVHRVHVKFVGQPHVFFSLPASMFFSHGVEQGWGVEGGGY